MTSINISSLHEGLRIHFYFFSFVAFQTDESSLFALLWELFRIWLWNKRKCTRRRISCDKQKQAATHTLHSNSIPIQKTLARTFVNKFLADEAHNEMRIILLKFVHVIWDSWMLNNFLCEHECVMCFNLFCKCSGGDPSHVEMAVVAIVRGQRWVREREKIQWNYMLFAYKWQCSTLISALAVRFFFVLPAFRSIRKQIKALQRESQSPKWNGANIARERRLRDGRRSKMRLIDRLVGIAKTNITSHSTHFTLISRPTQLRSAP